MSHSYEKGGSVELEAILVKVEPVQSGTWGVSALGLTFQLSDGRTTEPTFVAGTLQMDQFLAVFHARVLQDLVGTRLRIAVTDVSVTHPKVEEIFPPPPVPDVYRSAFEGGLEQSTEPDEGDEGTKA